MTSDKKRLLRSSAEVVRRVFNYHVIPGYVTTRNMVGENRFDTFESGSSVSITRECQGLYSGTIIKLISLQM